MSQWLTFITQNKQPLTMIVIVFGLPGSGKSYFASRLATMMDAEYVNSDRLRKEMFDRSVYSDEEKAAVYNNMLKKMKVAASQNRHIVLDATFHKYETRKLFIDATKNMDAFFFIELCADEKIISMRLQKERPDSEADIDVYTKIKQQWEPLKEPHLLLESTNENIKDLLQKAATYLQLKDDKRTDQ